MSLGSAIAIGAVSGLRTLAGPAVLAESASRNILRLRKTPLSWLSSNSASRVTALLAIGEMIADKLPRIPDRTNLGPLIARGFSGALCGVALAEHGTGFLSKPSKQKVLISAIAGFAGAVAASYIGNRYRRKLRSNPIVAALAEDAVAVGLGALAIRALP